MDKEIIIFLEHILESIEYIKSYTKDISKSNFISSIQLQDAVVRRIEIIGEAVSNLSENFKKNNPHIPWRDIVDMRNLLIHEYFGIDQELVWKTAQEDLFILQKEIDQILTKISKEK